MKLSADINENNNVICVTASKNETFITTMNTRFVLCSRYIYMIRTKRIIVLCSRDLRFNKIKDVEPKSLAHLTELNTL